MLSEERIRKMIRLSEYETGAGSTDLKITHYWKTDYVRMQLLKTCLCVLAATMLVFAVIAIYHLDYILQHMPEIPYHLFFLWGLLGFLIVSIPALVITARMAAREYDLSQSRVSEYYETLRELEKLYEEEESQEEELP